MNIKLLENLFVTVSVKISSIRVLFHRLFPSTQNENFLFETYDFYWKSLYFLDQISSQIMANNSFSKLPSIQENSTWTVTERF